MLGVTWCIREYIPPWNMRLRVFERGNERRSTSWKRVREVKECFPACRHACLLELHHSHMTGLLNKEYLTGSLSLYVLAHAALLTSLVVWSCISPEKTFSLSCVSTRRMLTKWNLFTRNDTANDTSLFPKRWWMCKAQGNRPTWLRLSSCILTSCPRVNFPGV